MYLKIKSLLIKCLSKLENKIKKFSFFTIFIFSTLSNSSELIEKTIAIVNNEPIFFSDLKQLEKRLGKSAMIDDLLLFDTTTEFLKKNYKAQLQFLINERVVDSEVKRHNLTVTMDRVDQEIHEISKRNNISKDELISSIKSQGINISEYQDFMKHRIERQSIVEQEVTSRIRLSDEDILAFYTSESGKIFKKSKEFTIYHILFDPQKSNPKEAFERAKVALVQIRNGKSFDSFLIKTTDDNGPSENGFLGTFKSGEFSSEFESAVKDLNVGDVSEIVKSRNGFHILKLVNKKDIPDPEFEKLKEKYRGQLFERVFKRQFKAWLDLKREESSIKIN